MMMMMMIKDLQGEPWGKNRSSFLYCTCSELDVKKIPAEAIAHRWKQKKKQNKHAQPKGEKKREKNHVPETFPAPLLHSVCLHPGVWWVRRRGGLAMD